MIFIQSFFFFTHFSLQIRVHRQRHQERSEKTMSKFWIPLILSNFPSENPNPNGDLA